MSENVKAPSDPATRSGWTIYDRLAGPELDSSRWEPLNMGTGPLLEPEARTTVENGVWTVDIAEFKNFDLSNQALDNSKHVILSTQGLPIPADGVGRFAVELRAGQVGDGDSGDYRYGVVSFNVVDTAAGLVFDILSTGKRFFAEHEVLAYPGQEHPFTRVIHDPLFFSRAGNVPDPEFRHCELEIDRSRGRVVWKVDGAVLHQADGLTDLPDEVHIGIGAFTLLPVGQGGSSVHGQGAHASWRNFTYHLSAEGSAAPTAVHQ